MNYLEPPPNPQAVEVYKDVGGVVRHYQAATAMYRAENREVRLHECRSACTMALSLPNVCVYPDSILKFHQAYNRNTDEVDEGVTDELWRSYPPAVRARLGYLTRDYRVLTGSELISLGVRNCNKQKREAPEIMLAKARPQPAPESTGDFFGGVRTALAPLIGEDDGRAAVRPIRVARAPDPPARAALAPPDSSGRSVPEFTPPLPPIPQREDMTATASTKPTALGPAVASLQNPDGATPGETGSSSLQTAIKVPLPPRRPLLYAAAAPARPMPPVFYIRRSPQLKAIAGSFPVLEAQFVPLSTLRQKFASAGL